MTSSSNILLRAPKIALLSGSIREGSFNTSLIQVAANAAKALGADTHIINLKDYDLPLYNQDLESKSGLPESAIALKHVLGTTDAWIVSSPEYNGFPSPLLMNAYTWYSRGDSTDKGSPMYGTFLGKTALVVSTSPGAMGGLRTLNPHKTLLQNLGMNVLANSVAIGGAYKAFDNINDSTTVSLVDEKQQTMVNSAVETLYYKARDDANREATFTLLQKHMDCTMAGEYGSISLPDDSKVA